MKTPLSKLTRALKQITKADQVRIVSSAPLAENDNIQATIIALDFKKPGPSEKKYPLLQELSRLVMDAVYPERNQSDCICDWDINGGWASYLNKTLYTTYTLTLFTEL